MIGISLLGSTLFFFGFAFFLSLFTFKNKKTEKFLCYSLYIPIILNVVTYGYFASLFIRHQFAFDYVYQYSNLSMPKILLVASSWAGQAGSLLLWSFFCCFTLLIAHRVKEWKKQTIPILLFHQIIILLLVWNAKPFAKSAMVFMDGLGMNPALSHPLMIIHPPFAFIGYSFLSLLYATSIASLQNRNIKEWLSQTKKYAYIALGALSITTILGSLWAYEVIGWGGYWSFDPIENGTLITCLLIVAFIHAESLYRKQKWGLNLIYFIAILIYSSVIHMVLLIRSGLLKNLTQHSYSGAGLLIGLLFTDILTFVVPLILLMIKSNSNLSKKLIFSLWSKSGRSRAVVWLFLLMSMILFIDLNQPLLFNNLSLSSTPFSPFLQKLFMMVALCAYLLLCFSASTFAKSRTIRIHSLGKTLVQILISSIFVLLFLVSLQCGLSAKTAILFIILLIPTLGIAKTIPEMIPLPWFKWGKHLAHCSICLLLLSIILTNLISLEERISLEKGIRFVSDKYSILMLETTQNIPQYIGNKTQYTLDFLKGAYQFSAHPSLWEYQRNRGNEVQKIPYIQILPECDIMVIPTNQGTKTLVLNQETILKGLLVTMKEYSRKKDNAGFLYEKTVINFQKEVNEIDREPYLIQEEYTLTRRLSQKGLALENSKITPSMLGEEIEWVKTENENTILLTSPSIAKTFEFLIITKPYMLLLRISYFLLILSLLWIILMNQFQEKFSKRNKKKDSRNTLYRDHHQHH